MKTLTELITAFVSAGPRLMDKSDLMGYAGVEGTGFIASTPTGDIIMDVSDTEVSYHFEPYADGHGASQRLQFSSTIDKTWKPTGMIVALTEDLLTENETAIPAGCRSFSVDASTLRWAPGVRSAEVTLILEDGPYRLKIRPGRMSRNEGTMYTNDDDSRVVIVWND